MISAKDLTNGRSPSHDDPFRGANAKTTNGGTAPLDVLDYRSTGRYPPKKDSPLVVVCAWCCRILSLVWRLLYSLPPFHWSRRLGKWRHYEMSYLVLAGISTPLVLSVHSTVSFDFATSLIPGWHTTIFPPYFVAGAIFGGFAMVLTLLIPARSLYKLHDIITWNHIDVMCKIILLTGSMVGYSYFMEFFVAFYGANPYERFIFLNRYFGPYWWVGYGMFTCNVIIPQLFWVRAFRRNIITVYFVAMCVNVGMWYERFAIIAVSLHRDFLPSSWQMYYPTWVDVFTFVGTIGIFVTLFLLFIRSLPMVAMSEVKSVLPEADPHYCPSPAIKSIQVS
jgi:Ni/Fe-hydrogenase subunit HybB-like protein